MYPSKNQLSTVNCQLKKIHNSSKKQIINMYDIAKQSAPKLPTLGIGTECIKFLLSQTSKDMHEPLVPMLFPIL